MLKDIFLGFILGTGTGRSAKGIRFKVFIVFIGSGHSFRCPLGECARFYPVLDAGAGEVMPHPCVRNHALTARIAGPPPGKLTPEGCGRGWSTSPRVYKCDRRPKKREKQSCAPLFTHVANCRS